MANGRAAPQFHGQKNGPSDDVVPLVQFPIAPDNDSDNQHDQSYRRTGESEEALQEFKHGLTSQ